MARIIKDIVIKMRNVAIACVLLAGVVIALNYLPLLASHAAQDRCSFGPISNEEYRRYLAEAVDRQRTIWPPFTSDRAQIEKQLNYRLQDLAGADKSPYVRLAKLHAVLRAVGAEYLNVNGRRDADPYGAAPARRENVDFNYSVDINRLVSFQLYPRQVWIIASLGTNPSVTNGRGELRLVAHVLYFLDRPPENSLESVGESCPPMPSGIVADQYQNEQQP